MVQTYSRWPGSRNYNNYPEEAINRALRATADDGISLRRASEEHVIPFGTLYNKHHAYSLLKRHKHKYSKRIAINIKRARAILFRSVVYDYFSTLEVILKDIPPSNIFNYDEPNISDNPGKSWLYIEEE
nr:unnamed protein product [Callosobruchus analis]